MKTYTIAPTDLTFGMRCPACLHAKRTLGWKPPYTPFPSVFSGLDAISKKLYSGRKVSEVFIEQDVFEDGSVFGQGSSVKSKPIKLSNSISIVINGRTDTEVKHIDGSISVLDYKISASSDIGIYEVQLWAYLAAIENSAKARPRAVKGFGTLNMKPMVEASPHFHIQRPEIVTPGINMLPFMESVNYRLFDAEERLKWQTFLQKSLLPVLEGPHEPDPTCPGCMLREHGKPTYQANFRA